MIKVAITGNIGSGKTVVCDFLEEKGYKVLFADKVAHNLLDDSKELLDTFKDFDITYDGKISREKLGNVVFNNPAMLEKLNAIIHPFVRIKIQEFFEENASEDFVFVEIPLLYESKMENLFDKVILICSDDNVRLKRLMERNEYSKEYAIKRIEAQMPQDEKVKKADYVIMNNGSVEDFTTEISKIVSLF